MISLIVVGYYEAVHKSLCRAWFGVLFCHAAQIGSRSVPGQSKSVHCQNNLRNLLKKVEVLLSFGVLLKERNSFFYSIGYTWNVDTKTKQSNQ